jgi:hypothetical protein
MDWKWLLGDAEFYVQMAAEGIVYVLAIALIFSTGERVLHKFGLWDPTPPNKRPQK